MIKIRAAALVVYSIRVAIRTLLHPLPVRVPPHLASLPLRKTIKAAVAVP